MRCGTFSSQIDPEWFYSAGWKEFMKKIGIGYENYEDFIDENLYYVDKNLLFTSISTFDSNEYFYHGFLLSLLSGIPGYTAYSNCESGEGRPDIILYPDDPEQTVILFELKARKKLNEMAKGLDEALHQIKEKKYAEGILEEGYVRVKAYGICFCKKTCIAAMFI